VPVRWWRVADNFGDLLAPWLVSRMTGREVTLVPKGDPHYLTVGSVLNLSSPGSVVWGSGSFGTEAPTFAPDARYTAVRGPLSRARLVKLGLDVPDVFGDPALLVPAYFSPRVEKTHAYGIVVRWSEKKWQHAAVGPGVRLIDLGSDDVEGTIRAILSCRRIVTGSLHGLVMADAYGIPSAWTMVGSEGAEFKFFDYFTTVDKFRVSQPLAATRPVTAARLRAELDFDARPIVFDHRALLDACPFLRRRSPAGVDRPAGESRALVGSR
jgi:pyruvyltransferase